MSELCYFLRRECMRRFYESSFLCEIEKAD